MTRRVLWIVIAALAVYGARICITARSQTSIRAMPC